MGGRADIHFSSLKKEKVRHSPAFHVSEERGRLGFTPNPGKGDELENEEVGFSLWIRHRCIIGEVRFFVTLLLGLVGDGE